MGIASRTTAATIAATIATTIIALTDAAALRCR